MDREAGYLGVDGVGQFGSLGRRAGLTRRRFVRQRFGAVTLSGGQQFARHADGDAV
ncbi:hypothetical protein FRUB_08156 [Fimbriiglobus ruber]|uniref:Uncharacterized protein n=1 Tax=Fimbriiglobus ruber TaxID=1908690 RepID=A0A225D3R0_9BACT|nr:hypothetical protein FRUB_08156 [Fimbriiglobus ruber]